MTEEKLLALLKKHVFGITSIKEQSVDYLDMFMVHINNLTQLTKEAYSMGLSDMSQLRDRLHNSSEASKQIPRDVPPNPS